VIHAADLAPRPYSDVEKNGLTWDKVRDEIMAITFTQAQSYGAQPDAQITFYLDDVRLYGMHYEDFGFTYREP
jgi:hypothetical protein